MLTYYTPALTIFLIVMTNLILLIGAGLFSKAIWSFQENAFNNLLGADVDDAGGDGPGSYDVRGNVWHLDCCNPETDMPWGIFNAVLGWTNSATQGSVLSYVFYWAMVIVVLVCMKFKEVCSFSTVVFASLNCISILGSNQAFWVGVCGRHAQATRRRKTGRRSCWRKSPP
jgi:FTR1 family protein